MTSFSPALTPPGDPGPVPAPYSPFSEGPPLGLCPVLRPLSTRPRVSLSSWAQGTPRPVSGPGPGPLLGGPGTTLPAGLWAPAAQVEPPIRGAAAPRCAQVTGGAGTAWLVCRSHVWGHCFLFPGGGPGKGPGAAHRPGGAWALRSRRHGPHWAKGPPWAPPGPAGHPWPRFREAHLGPSRGL